MAGMDAGERNHATLWQLGDSTSSNSTAPIYCIHVDCFQWWQPIQFDFESRHSSSLQPCAVPFLLYVARSSPAWLLYLVHETVQHGVTDATLCPNIFSLRLGFYWLLGLERSTLSTFFRQNGLERS